MEKYYQLATHTEAEWDEINAELTGLGRVSEYVPNREIDCVDDQLLLIQPIGWTMKVSKEAMLECFIKDRLMLDSGLDQEYYHRDLL